MTVPKDFPYTLTTHADRVIKERQIAFAWITRTLAHPMKIELDQDDPELHHALSSIPEHDERVLRVVYNKNTDPWLIVTAYFDQTQRGKL